MKMHRMVLGGVAATLALAACAPASSSSSESSSAAPASAAATSASSAAASTAAEPVTLKVWSWQASMADKWDEVLKTCSAKFPGMTVEFKGYNGTDYPTVLKTGLSGSDGPDIVMLHPYGSVLPYVKAGQIAEIDPATIPELSNFTQDSLNAATFDGKLYGVPFAKQTVQVFYNKKIFADNGITPPTTVAEIQPMVDKLVAAGVTPYAVTGKDSWQLVNVFDALVGNTYGGRDFIEKALKGEVKFTDPAFVDALAQFQALKPDFPDQVSAVDYTTSQTLFNSGKAAMFPGGSWELGGFRTANASNDIGVFSMPSDAGGAAPTWGYEDGSLAISAKSAHPAEALKLLGCMSTPEFGQALTDTLAQSSSVVGVQATDPVLAEMNANFEANPVPMVWVTDYFGVAAPAPYAALMDATQRLLLDKTTPEEAAQSIQENVDAWNAEQAKG